MIDLKHYRYYIFFILSIALFTVSPSVFAMLSDGFRETGSFTSIESFADFREWIQPYKYIMFICFVVFVMPIVALAVMSNEKIEKFFFFLTIFMTSRAETVETISWGYDHEDVFSGTAYSASLHLADIMGVLFLAVMILIIL